MLCVIKHIIHQRLLAAHVNNTYGDKCSIPNGQPDYFAFSMATNSMQEAKRRYRQLLRKPDYFVLD